MQLVGAWDQGGHPRETEGAFQIGTTFLFCNDGVFGDQCGRGKIFTLYPSLLIWLDSFWELFVHKSFNS